MRRCWFLATGTALLSAVVAGCGHHSVVLGVDDATADDIADEVSTTADLGSEEYTLVTSPRENGSATRSGLYELFDRTNAVRVDDSFDEVSEARLTSSEVTVYEDLIDFEPEDTTPKLDEIEYENLPETDRQRLDSLFSGETPASQDGFGIGFSYETAGEVGERIGVRSGATVRHRRSRRESVAGWNRLPNCLRG
ncbi:hypothetical protein GCM10009000_053640 [Halobacterium noricense]|uniref:Uncharacterized protein n=1 Tax=Haladaptatus pallidirubidus TaxID=1008152 RepID=A0AAV3UMZ0_9EURY|nr:hypothetical protein [Haladaptatus pallidirubidus]